MLLRRHIHATLKLPVTIALCKLLIIFVILFQRLQVSRLEQKTFMQAELMRLDSTLQRAKLTETARARRLGELPDKVIAADQSATGRAEPETSCLHHAVGEHFQHESPSPVLGVHGSVAPTLDLSGGYAKVKRALCSIVSGTESLKLVQHDVFVAATLK